MHSLTKYLNGHGDVVGGVACANAALAKVMRQFRKDIGCILSPMDSFLVVRGIRTLGVRMEKHNANAIAVAKFLRGHPKVKSVMHPVFEDFPGHDVAVSQMTGFGSTFSFELFSFEAAKEVLKHLHVCTLAVSLGNVDTLIEHPASMTHVGVPLHIMRQQGLSPELIRISVGLEDAKDIIADLAQALEKC